MNDKTEHKEIQLTDIVIIVRHDKDGNEYYEEKTLEDLLFNKKEVINHGI